MSKRIVLEICVDSVASAVAAEKGGADRVELCQNLFEGGTTPSAGMIEVVRRSVQIPVFVIIRPRGADFCYSSEEMRVMRTDIIRARELGAQGIVIGVLKANGAVDRRRLRELIDLARPLPVTFHRAFDVARDPHEAMDVLIDLGVERVLTSGQEKSVWEGIEVVAELEARYGKQIIVMPGGGITDRNFEKIRKLSGAHEFHMSASMPVSSKMTYQSARVPMGRELRPPEYAWTMTSVDKVRKVVGGGGK